MVTYATNMFEIWIDRRLLALLALLMSAFVLAEQSDKTFSYDELMKDTIFGSSRNWRTESTNTEDEWRADPAEESHKFGKKGTSKEDRIGEPRKESGYNYEYEELDEQSVLFKIKL